jgi:hypothetical protein
MTEPKKWPNEPSIRIGKTSKKATTCQIVATRGREVTLVVNAHDRRRDLPIYINLPRIAALRLIKDLAEVLAASDS